jgi:hypothetical protein
VGAWGRRRVVFLSITFLWEWVWVLVLDFRGALDVCTNAAAHAHALVTTSWWCVEIGLLQARLDSDASCHE